MNYLNPVMTYTGIPNPTQYLEPQSSPQEQELWAKETELATEKEIWTIPQRIKAKEKVILAKEEELAAEKDTLYKAKQRLADKVEDLAKKNPKRNQTDRKKWIEYINGLRTSEILKNQAIISIINSAYPDKCYRLWNLFQEDLRVDRKLIGQWEEMYGLSEDLKTTLVLNSTVEPHKVVETMSMKASSDREAEHTASLEETPELDKMDGYSENNFNSDFLL